MSLLNRLNENHQLFNITLWDSNRAQLFITSPHPGPIILLMLAVCLLMIIVLGFGFYLWFFFTSSEHSQVRLLNMLNVYLSVGCICGSVTAFIKMLTSGLGYPDNSMERIIGKPYKIFKKTLTSFTFYDDLGKFWRGNLFLNRNVLFFSRLQHGGHNSNFSPDLPGYFFEPISAKNLS